MDASKKPVTVEVLNSLNEGKNDPETLVEVEVVIHRCNLRTADINQIPRQKLNSADFL